MANFLFQHWWETRRYLKSSDGQFYLQQRRRLFQFPAFEAYANSTSLFTMIQAVIILKGLLQKETIDQYLKQQGQLSIQQHGRIKHHLIRERYLLDLHHPYQFIDQNHQPIILPFFNRALNYIYAHEPDKLYDYPYSRLEEDFSTSIIDAFEHYGWQLYQSKFASLFCLSPHDRSTKAFYEPHARVVLMINQQGRLDAAISLFDRGVKKPDLTNIEAKLNLAIAPYFNNDRAGLIHQLHAQGLISTTYQQALQKHPKVRMIHRG